MKSVMQRSAAMPFSATTSANVFDDAERASRYVAQQMALLIREHQQQGKKTVLGLATGNTQKLVYSELVRLHQDEGLSFKDVISFNLDEYYPISAHDKLSYTYFMRENLFRHIDIDAKNSFIPHTDCAIDGTMQYCRDYEEKIRKYGGLDFQLLGIGRNGHIGFNEPGSCFYTGTRLVNLHPMTREDATSDFGDITKVPQQAISIGINTIVQARRIVLLAFGKRKAEIIAKAIKGKVNTQVPASILQTLPQVEYVLDREAATYIQD